MIERSLLTAGYAVIDKINGQEYFGGAAAGIATNAARLEICAGLCSVFGVDRTSDLYWNQLLSEGVNMAMSARDPEYKLPENTVSHEDRNSGWNDFGKQAALSRFEIGAQHLQKYPFVHVASPHQKMLSEVIQNTKSEQVVSYSPGPKLKTDPQAYLSMDVLSQVNMIFLNEEEWQQAQNWLNIGSPADLLMQGIDRLSKCIVTLGEKGAIIAYKNGERAQSIHVVPRKLLHVVDSTGAGDAFALGFLAGQMVGLDEYDSGNIAVNLASQSLKHNGVVMEL